MHPQIFRNAPGNCPICGMALEPRTATGDEEESPELLANPPGREMMHSTQAGLVPAPHDSFMDTTSPGSAPKEIQQIERLSRPGAIELLRSKLQSLCDDEHCACAAAAHLGVFCQGFRKLSDADFRKRFDWIARKRPKATRAELEKLVSYYHLGRQEVTGAAICCDAETREHCACDGWNMFDNSQLETFCRELAKRTVRIE